MDEARIARIESSFNLLAHRADELADRFYATLFSRHSTLREMFPAEMLSQKKKLVASLVFVVKSLRKPDELRDALLHLGARHNNYGTEPEQYGAVRDALLDVMSEMAGDVWTDELTADWTAAINHVAEVMIEGQKQAALQA